MDFSVESSTSRLCLSHKVLESSQEQKFLIREHCAIPYGPSELPLRRPAIIAYGTGHMLNDLTAACWFTYLLIFLTDVGLSPKQAGEVMLVGQITDGIGTICIGQLIDKYGKFKRWHAWGSLIVATSFSSVFGGCWACNLVGAKSTKALVHSYSFFAAVFNLGWAAAQVSHMSLVNCVTANATSRVALNSCKTAFNMLANLCLYGIAFAVFKIIPSATVAGVHRQFRWIVGLEILIGVSFILIFHHGVGEPRLMHHQGTSILKSKVPALSWFRKLLYYQVAAIYVLTRLIMNVSQALLPFYIVDDLMLGQSAKAVIPAIVFLSSLVCSFFMQELNWTSVKLKAFFTCGAASWILCGATLYFIPRDLSSIIYVVSIVVGAANASMQVAAASMQAILVDRSLSGCAFVYGSLSFLDKLACGLALYTIEHFHGDSRRCNGSQKSFICSTSVVRLVLAVLPGACACVAAFVAMWTHLDKKNTDELMHEPLLHSASTHPATLSDVESTVAVTLPVSDGSDFPIQPVSSVRNFYGVRGRSCLAETNAGQHRSPPPAGADGSRDGNEEPNSLAPVPLWKRAAVVRAPSYSILHHEHKP